MPATLEKFIKHWYTTRCPSCGGDAELVYALWVKRHPCLNALCQAPEVRFFKNYLVTQKELGVSYIEDCICPACSTENDPKTFDWELEPASLLFLPGLANQIAVPGQDAGSNRKIHGGGHKIRWAYAALARPCPMSPLPKRRGSHPSAGVGQGDTLGRQGKAQPIGRMPLRLLASPLPMENKLYLGPSRPCR